MSDKTEPSFTTAKPQGQVSQPKGKGGRPPDPNALDFYTVGVRPAQLRWLKLWRPGETNMTTLLGDVIERAMRFWPAGPDAFGHSIKPPRKRMPRKALDEYARAHNLTRQEAIAELVTKQLGQIAAGIGADHE